MNLYKKKITKVYFIQLFSCSELLQYGYESSDGCHAEEN